MLITDLTLLMNLGTPKTPYPDAVGEYLVEFLTDPDVITIPSPFRQWVVKTLIVPKRKFESSKAYQKIWTDRGSPLLFHTQDLAEKLNALTLKTEPHHRVEFAMRYGEPSIFKTIQKVLNDYPKLERLTLAPLYPQAAAASTDTAVKEVLRSLKKLKKEFKFISNLKIRTLKAFYLAPEFIECFANRGKAVLDSQPWDHVIFSFHGLPESAIRKKDPSRSYCLKTENCSEQIHSKNHFCYRAQCFSTAQSLAKKLGIPKEKYSIGFQSRLGPTRWIQPYLDHLYVSLPKQGIRHAVLFSAAFVADCLETLEEIQVRGSADFKKAGGESLLLVPSLNSGDDWVEGLNQILKQNQNFEETPFDHKR